MRNKVVLLLALGLLLNIFFVANIFAQEEPKRVIEESLVLKDPTVAAEKKWLVGGSFEYWYLRGEYNQYNSNGVKTKDGTISGGMPGGNIFVGYDNFTLQYSYRKGDFDVNYDFVNSAANSVLKKEQAEQEITLRYLIKPLSAKHFVPYVVAGYNYTTNKETETLSTGWRWTYKSATDPTRATKVIDRTYSSPLVGLGAIIPFNNYIGMRADLRAMYSSADWKRDDGTKQTGSGIGGAVILTGYWNIWQGLNLQVGGKWQYLNGGSDVGSDSKFGVFGMLGYVYKF